MKSKMMKKLVAALVLASSGLMGCEPSKDAEGPVNITVIDADGNKYPTMKIGQQIWMAKNLNVNIEGSKCYDNDPKNCEKYGRLYTWSAALKACPSGWHLPSKEEMDAFVEAVKVKVDQIVISKKQNAEPLKRGEDRWSNHLRHADWFNGYDSFGYDSFGFSALPAGHIVYDKFGGLGDWTEFWSSKEYNAQYASSLSILGRSAEVKSSMKSYGYSIRCIRN